MPMLTAAGHEITGLDSGLFTHANLGPAPAPVRELSMDVRDVDESHLDGMAAVIHLAGISNDPLDDLNPECTYAINCRARRYAAGE
jgi:nucleoside-diphosphate-sugar epimerase